MARKVLLEEFHLSLYARDDLKPQVYRSIRRRLNHQAFQTRMLEALHQVLRYYPSLQKVHLKVSR